MFVNAKYLLKFITDWKIVPIFAHIEKGNTNRFMTK